MSVSRETKTHEWHSVKCATCLQRMSLKLPKSGTRSLYENSVDFTEDHRFVCKGCRKKGRSRS